MRLNAKLLIPWLFFSMLLFTGFFLFNLQFGILQTELSEHISIHQRSVKMARDLRYLSQVRLTTALSHQSQDARNALESIAESEQQSERITEALQQLLLDQHHLTKTTGLDEGRNILSAYVLANGSLAFLYREWFKAYNNNDALEPLKRLQLLNQFSMVKAVLDDLSVFNEVAQNQVVSQTNLRIQQAQLYFYIFMAIVLLAVIGFSVYQGRSIVLPLHKLSIAAHAIAQGKGAHFDVAASVDEIVSLNQSLSSMLTALQEAHTALALQKEKYRIVSDYSADWEYWLGADGRYIYVSPACEKISGLSAQAFYENPDVMDTLVHSDDRADWTQCLTIQEQSTEIKVTVFRLIRADGRLFWLENQHSPVFDLQGVYLGLRGVNRDITERKQLEQDRARYQQQLEQDVTARTEALVRQAHALEMSIKDLESFSYSVSHDLRAPLRAIDGFIDMLVEEHASQLDDEGKRMFKVVQDNARKMGCLIDDILAFSRAGRLEMDWQWVDMNALLNEVWVDLTASRNDVNVQLRASPLPFVECDPRAMRQILTNLISNAIKFSRQRQPGLVDVSAKITTDAVCFSVQDNGVGFNPEYVDKLFVMFQRLHGMDEFEGTGVGLAIVKRFVQKHGGTVNATAVPDGGATFSFCLPSSRQQPLVLNVDADMLDVPLYH